MMTSVALTAATPAWVLLEKGKVAYEERDLTTALDTLLDAVELNNEYPEAEYWLGRVYDAQGQAILAEEQYRRAIELSIYLRVPRDVIEYRYRLASLLFGLGADRTSEAEAILLSIADEEGASLPATIEREHQYIAVLTESGIDELLYLYRDELGLSLRARSILGETAWNDARYRTALLQSTRVVLSLLSTAAETYRASVPEWRFDIDSAADRLQPDRDVRYPLSNDGTMELLDIILNEETATGDWVQAEGLWPQLYLLGTSLHAEGHSETAGSIWQLLVVSDELTGTFAAKTQAGQWGRLAVRQLDEPFISRGSLAP